MSPGDPLHRVDSKLITVDILGFPLESGVVPAEAATVVLAPDAKAAAGIPQFASLSSSSVVRPCFANGAGSTPRLVKRSAREAKQRKAPSATCENK